MIDALVYGLAVSVVGAVGALLLKKGAKGFSLKKPVNRSLVLGFLCYVVATILFVLGVRDVPLSFFYPFTALLYLFAAALGVAVLNERLTRWKLMGIVLVVAGIVLNSVGRFA